MARGALSRELIIEAAVRVADAGGAHAVSMRHVGAELGVEAMSLYHHIPNKDALLNELVEWVYAQMVLPELDAPWRRAMFDRAAEARRVLAAHPWALGLIESRPTPMPSAMRHNNQVLGILRRNGFPLELAAHAYSVIDAYVFGFVLTEASLPFDSESGAEAEEFTAGIEVDLAEYPYLVEMITEKVTGSRYAFADEFGYGLDLILDEIERRRLLV